MAFTGNFMCTSFKVELLEAVHDFAAASNIFKLALYNNSASFTAATTAYASSNEISGTGYTAGGGDVTTVDPTDGGSGTTAFVDMNDVVFTNATISLVRGALIYNAAVTHTPDNPSVCVLDFGSDKAASAGDFTVVMPAANASNAIIRIA